jgi:hypothetical protein
MNINTILTIGLAIAAGAAIYFIFQEIQQEKRKVEALSQHMRRLESLVWTYNIRPQPAGGSGGEYATDTDVSDEEGMIQASSSPYPRTTDSYEEEDEGEGEGEVEAIPAGIPVSFSMFSFSNAAPQQQQQQPEAPPQIEVVEEDQHDDNNVSIPEVVSFDTTQRSIAPRQSSDAAIAIEDEQDPPSPTHSDGEVAVSETVVEKSDGEEVGEPKTTGRVYADTAKNRRLGRVGLSY